MNDDWRLRIELREHGLAAALTERLTASELLHDLKTTFQDRVIVSVDGSQVFCYTDTREQAEAVQHVIESLAKEHGWDVEYELKHWHPVAEQWEVPDLPLPSDDAQRAAEHRELIQREREEAQQRGYPEFEVRVQCESADQCAGLALTLRTEGVPTVQRSNFLLAGALDEDGANALAERIRREAPVGTVVSTEASLRAVMDNAPSNPFAIYGGLGG